MMKFARFLILPFILFAVMALGGHVLAAINPNLSPAETPGSGPPASLGSGTSPTSTPGASATTPTSSPTGGATSPPAGSTATAVAAGATSTCGKPTFFFLPPWYEYLNLKTDSIGQCVPDFHFPDDIWAVVLAVIDMLLRLGGFIAIISIVVSGVEHIFSGGNPEKAASARRRIYNSLIGLAIIVVATAVVSFVGKAFT